MASLFEKKEFEKEPEVEIDRQSSIWTSSSIEGETVQIMNISYKNWKFRSLQATSADSPDKPLYLIDTKFRKPNLIFKSPDTGAELGTTTYHTFKNLIDINLPNGAFELKGKRALSSTYSYTSPAFQHATLTWKTKWGWKGATCVCLDENQVPVAKFSPGGCWSCTKFGKVEFYPPCDKSPAARDEIMVTGLSVFYLVVSTYTASAASASASASSVAAIS